MTGLPSLLGALGLVALLFALVSFLLALFGMPTDLGWIVGNLSIGVVMLGIAVALNFDALRERLSSGEAQRAGKYGTSALMSAALAIGILAMLAFLSTRYHVRWDWSEEKVHSLSDQSRKVLQDLERDVEVVGLFAPLDAEPVRDLLDRYDYASERFRVVEFADPNARPDLLEKYGITPEKLGRGLLHITLGDGSVDVSDVSEENVTNALVKLSRTSEKTVYFLMGHNERAIEGEVGAERDAFSRAAEALRDENYNVEPLLLAAQGEVPADADAVIIASPTRPLLSIERASLKRYLARGGALLVLLDPGANTDLVDDVEQWGVDVGDDVVIDRKLAIFGQATTPLASKYDPEHEITKDFRETALFPMVRSVRAKREAADAIREIVFTGNDSWAERDLDRFYNEGRAAFDSEDLAGPVPIAVAGEVDLADQSAPVDDEAEPEQRKARIAVFGDADFASNEMLDAYLNRDLFVNSVNWLLGDVEAISVRPNRSRASRFHPTAAEFQRIRLLSLFVLPEALAILGVFTWWSRRQRADR